MTQSSSARKSDYTVKSVETVADGADVRVRLFTLGSGEIIPWHYHSQCSDHYFVLEGVLTVETRHPPSQSVVQAGAGYRLQAGLAHRISNLCRTDCRFILVQGVGRFDWIKAEQQ